MRRFYPSKLRYWVALLFCVAILVRSLPAGGASLATAPDIPWDAPPAIAVNNTGQVSTADTANLYDCTRMTYRIIDDFSKTMHDGCFISTAYGLVDPAASMLIYNGSDEAMPIKPDGSALSILPNSVSVAKFGIYSGIGSYMYLYTNFPSALEQQGIPRFGRSVYISGQPNYVIRDDAGQPMPVNPQALAYSARSQWLVTEYPTHSLVRINLADFSILPFDKSFYIPSMPFANHTAHMAITEDGRYAAVASNEFTSFKVYDFKNCTPPGDTAGLAPYNCPSYDYWNFIKSQVSGPIRRISQVKFVQDGLISFTVTYSNGSSESYLMAPANQITSLIPYLGLGDSYASGEGAWNYRSGTDTAVNHCHLSVHSYPLRLNGNIFGNGGNSVACSGARLTDIINQSPNYSGQAGDNKSAKDREADGSETSILHDFLPGYLAQQNFIDTYQPGIVTVMIGGNDVGFKDILLRCLSPGDCYQTYEDRLEVEQTIDRNYARWVSAYKQLQQSAPAARVYAIGYPQIVSSVGDCGLNVRLSMADISLAREVTNYLNAVIQKAAQAAGVHYVDISDALAGYELCSGQMGQPAMNGITAGGDTLGIIGRESFHPTALGHDLIEQAILRTTHNFAVQPKPVADPTVSMPTPSDSDVLLQVPKSGRSITSVIPASGIVAGRAVAGGSLTININGLGYGLSPLTSYAVRVNGLVLATMSTDSQGNIHATITLPILIDPGLVTLAISGPGQGGGNITVTEVIYIEHSLDDYDGDNLANANDSCPGVVNSGIDSDHDGTDDSCDSFLGGPVPVQIIIAGIRTRF